jgi:Spy/CpxP family protein refolding chaperone
MKVQFKILLVLLSVALNVAFVGGWVTRTIHAAHEKKVVQSSEGTHAGIPVFYEQLGVTQEQWQKIRPQLETFQASALAVFQDINRRRQEFLALLAAPQADRATIAEKQKEILAAQARMQELVISHILAEKKLLTPEQRRKYFELLAQSSDTLCENLMAGLRPAATNGDSRPDVPWTKQ